jgi:hypothetical protein
MWIFLSIGVGVMQAVHNGVGPWTHVRRTLGDIGQDKKEFFPTIAHSEGTMGRIPVLKECLRKQRRIPEHYEKNYDNHKKNVRLITEVRTNKSHKILVEVMKIDGFACSCFYKVNVFHVKEDKMFA